VPDENNPPPTKTCERCTNDNLLKNVGIRKCTRCTQLYCIHFASLLEGNEYCVECLSDLTLLKNEEVYSRKDYDLLADKERIVRRRATTYKIGGLDYLFAQRRNAAMSDAELELKIEYFREQTTSMIIEREERKIKKSHEKTIKIGATTTTTTVSTSTGTTSQTVVEKKKNQLNNLLSGMKPEDALAIFAKLMGKGK